jgi:hypothetical protein
MGKFTLSSRFVVEIPRDEIKCNRRGAEVAEEDAENCRRGKN